VEDEANCGETVHSLQFFIALFQGKFVETAQCGGYLYGLTREAIESVARKGLACTLHMELEVRIFVLENKEVIKCITYKLQVNLCLDMDGVNLEQHDGTSHYRFTFYFRVSLVSKIQVSSRDMFLFCLRHLK
jgi:hypothetical protein